jgi:putative membrane protein
VAHEQASDQLERLRDYEALRRKLAESRTDLAEDRTMMAGERTFAGWMRTGLAMIGLGVAFNALFDKMSQPWFPRAVATMFILIGIGVFALAERRAARLVQTLDGHRITPIAVTRLRLLAAVTSLGAAALIVGIWLLR